MTTGRRRRAGDVVERALVVYLVVWALAWIGVGVLDGTRPLGVTVPVAVAWVCLAVVVAVPFGPRTWARATVPAAVVAAAALTVAGVVALLGVDTAAATTWPSGVSYISVAVGVVALRLPTRAAAVVGAGLVVVLSTTVLVASSRADLGARPVDAVLFGLYVLVLGVVCLTFAAVLRPVAAAADTAREAVEAAEDRRRAVDAAGRDVAAQERALHDVVLNTLGVIARGVPGDPERVRGWCARAAAEVRSLPTPRPTATPPADSTDLVETALRSAPGSAGPRVGPRVDLADVPDAVRLALTTAVGEALRNAHAHAPGAPVLVQAERLDGGGIRVVVADEGPGFDPAQTPQRLGLARSVHGAMRLAAGTADVTALPGVGCRVTLLWSPPDGTAAARRFGDAVGEALTRALPAFLLPATALALLSLLVGLPEYADPAPALAAFAVFLGVVAVEIAAGRRRHIGWPVVVVACTAAIATHALEGLAQDLQPGLWSSWSTEAVLATLMVVVVGGPRWSWLPAMATWWAMLGFDPLEFVRPGGALLLSTVLFAAAVRAGTARLERSVRVAADLEAETEALSAAAGRRGDRWAALGRSTLPLLDALADGRLDPADPGVRARCRDEERFVRTLVRLDPEHGPLPTMLLEVAAAAREAGVPLDVELRDDIGPDLVLEPAALSAAGAALRAAVAGLPVIDGADPARLTGGSEGPGVVLRLVAEPAADLWEIVLPAAAGSPA